MKNFSFSIIAVFNDLNQGLRGNTAAVIFSEKLLTLEKMQRIASDFNQPATTFLWPEALDDTYGVRWFAPDAEIDLCGHGSLAAIAFLTKNKQISKEIKLIYANGSITGKATSENKCNIVFDQINIIREDKYPPLLPDALGVAVRSYFITKNKHIVLLDSEQEVKFMKPDFMKLRQIETFGYAVTAPGEKVDFVSRTLVPHVQQLEDHATGSSHAALAPFWAERLHKNKLIAHQLSPRGGKFYCKVENSKVHMEGNYTTIASGSLDESYFTV